MNNKKNIFFIIGSLNAGGAEKSLISLLHSLSPNDYNIDLMLMKQEGLFLSMLPKHVKIIKPCIALECYATSPSDYKFYLKNGIRLWIKKFFRLLLAKMNKKLNLIQELWKRWSPEMLPLNNNYDVAIAYIDEAPTYYLIEHVSAKKKIVWNHCDYNLLNHEPTFDEYYYKSADNIVTISNECKKRLTNIFPTISPNKILVLNNISNGKLINQLSNEKQEDEIFNNSNGIRLLSVGRLSRPKNYPLALKAAVILKKKLTFSWFIIGEGPLRDELENMCKSLGLNENVHFLGLRSNPYYYMKNVDCMVMSSISEGKSIAVDEAKILQLPIVSTNYPTVYDNLKNGINGIITEMTPEALADGIYKVLTDKSLREYIKCNLKNESEGNIKELSSYIKLFNLD